MSRTTDQVEKKLGDTYSKVLNSYGLKPTLTQIYLAIFFSTKPITLKEISEKTGYSISNVSTRLKLLERLTDIEKHNKPGSKTNYFTCRHDVKESIKRKIQQQKKDIIEINKQIKDGVVLLRGDKTKKANIYRKRLKRLSKEYDEVEELLNKVTVYLENE